MTTAVCLDGKLVPPEQATVSIFDRGFLYGDSVYEVLRTYGGRPFQLERHLERLESSATRIGLTLPWPRARYGVELERTLAAAGNAESYVRLVVTRGAGEIGLDPANARSPLSLVIVRELHPPPPEVYRDGVKVQVVGIRKNPKAAIDPLAKTGNYLNSVLAMQEAVRAGAFEAVLLDREGAITEGSSSNLFVVHGGVLATPPLDAGILEGVTRHFLLEVARGLGVPVEERRLFPEQLLAADEALLTSSIRELVPITRVGDADGEHPIGDGEVGPVVLRITAAFREQARRSVGLAPGAAVV